MPSNGCKIIFALGNYTNGNDGSMSEKMPQVSCKLVKESGHHHTKDEMVTGIFPRASHEQDHEPVQSATMAVQESETSGPYTIVYVTSSQGRKQYPP